MRSLYGFCVHSFTIDSKGKGLETHYVIRHNLTDGRSLDYRPFIAA